MSYVHNNAMTPSSPTPLPALYHVISTLDSHQDNVTLGRPLGGHNIPKSERNFNFVWQIWGEPLVWICIHSDTWTVPVVVFSW